MATPDLSGQTFDNLLRNGSFEEWNGGGAPSYWSLSGAGAAIAKDVVNLYIGAAAAAVTRAGADATLLQSVANQTIALSYIKGRTFSASVQLRKASGAKVRLGIDDGVSVTWSGFGCHVGDWEQVSVVHVADNNATKLDLRIEFGGADVQSQVDAVALMEGELVPAFTPNPADPVDPVNLDQTVPATPTGLTLTSRPLQILLAWTANPESDINYYEIQRATDAGFTANLLSWRVDALRFTDIPGDMTTRYYRIRAVRRSGTPSAWTTGVNGAALAVSSTDVDTSPPTTPTGLALATGTTLDADGTVQVYLDLSWNANSEADLYGYQVDYRRQGDTPFASRIVRKETLSVREIGVVGNIVYEARIAAIDIFGNVSAFTTLQTITTAMDTSAPAVPTSITITEGFQLLLLRWVPPTAVDWDVVEVWRSLTNDSSQAAKVGEIRGISFIDDKLANATTYYYWLRSRDTSGNLGTFHAGQFAGLAGTTKKIAGADVLTTEAIITVVAQIANAIIQNAHIVSLSADKLTAATIEVLLKLGVNNIELDGVNDVITIKDTQGTPVTRVQIGKLGAGAGDWGIKMWNAAGALMYDFSTGAETAGIKDNAVSNVGVTYVETPSDMPSANTEYDFGTVVVNVTSAYQVVVLVFHEFSHSTVFGGQSILYKDGDGTAKRRIETLGFDDPFTSGSGFFLSYASYMWVDQSPGSGSKTYRIKGKSDVGTSGVDQRYLALVALVLKK